MRRYKLSNDAENDLIGIWKYIAVDNQPAADAMYDMFYSKFSLLATNPQIGLPAATIARGIRKFPAGQYLIYYQVTKGTLIIVRVLHGKRQQRQAYRR